MFENKSQAIGNALMTLKGTYVFYRDLGLDAVDGNNPPMRKDITVLLAKYYPDVKVKAIERVPIVTAQDENEALLGQYKYNVSIGD